ncbi:MAG: hypothetical protein HC788_04455, partial [Sphingopyxis sp.]|nr:hypothetical protein [Sphingopyxis sp.]
AALVVLFVVYAALRLDLSTVKEHLVLAGIVFAVGFVSFVVGWIGGGDVKLLTALTLWAGPSHGPELLVMTTLVGSSALDLKRLGRRVTATPRARSRASSRSEVGLGASPACAARRRCRPRRRRRFGRG